MYEQTAVQCMTKIVNIIKHTRSTIFIKTHIFLKLRIVKKGTWQIIVFCLILLFEKS